MEEIVKMPDNPTLQRFCSYRVKDLDQVVLNNNGDTVPLAEATDIQLAGYLIELERLEDFFNEMQKTISVNKDTVSIELGKKMLDDERPMFKCISPNDGIHRTVRVKTEAYTSIKKGNEIEAYAWLELQGLGSILKLSVHPATLKSTLEKWLTEHKLAVNFAPPSLDEASDFAEVEEGPGLFTYLQNIEEKIAMAKVNPEILKMTEQEALPPQLFSQYIVNKARVYKK